tara:strand:- start:222 stop:434 length:213 start_codon:yes stop_codon:yes gene_type:complete
VVLKDMMVVMDIQQEFLMHLQVAEALEQWVVVIPLRVQMLVELEQQVVLQEPLFKEQVEEALEEMKMDPQ